MDEGCAPRPTWIHHARPADPCLKAASWPGLALRCEARRLPDRGRKEGDSAHLWSRNGRDWSVEFSGITAALKAWRLKSFVLDGEACACDESGWPDFMLGGGKTCASACFFAFDLLELDGADLRSLPFSERYARLARMLASAPEAIHLSEHTADHDGNALFQHACRLGLEGIVAKKRAARYRSGRCASWVKVKNPDYARR